MLTWFWLYYILANVAFLTFFVFVAYLIVGYLHYRKKQRQQPPPLTFDIETYSMPLRYYTEDRDEYWDKILKGLDK